MTEEISQGVIVGRGEDLQRRLRTMFFGNWAMTIRATRRKRSKV